MVNLKRLRMRESIAKEKELRMARKRENKGLEEGKRWMRPMEGDRRNRGLQTMADEGKCCLRKERVTDGKAEKENKGLEEGKDE